ncbi:serine/threonine-protein kinase [Sandaracinus amylolyticus]|uniref:serine/threonine-protein kinase n=1 Tax=Sandaracinus amylolyticus TaxID=927083 RepID=UPI001F21BD76|nr:serine/threonine-protein kinase [Sandaracinus amylolyticus]UJR78681.1 Serine/threonine protein kinase PrkC, regulator of stationary phase [Sandaracinus amylolyticus]
MPSHLPEPGAQVERYTVLFEVARGGMAVVYAARRTGIGGFDKIVALKLMSPAMVTERRYVDMFLDEARIAARIDHPNVVQVFEVGEHEGLPFLVMELVQGVALTDVLRATPPPPLAIRAALLAAAARGLHAAHETLGADGAPLGLVHRDVSPHNVLVGFDGRVKVTDFGIAAARGRITHTASGELKGKMSYLAPEQITRERPTDRRADVWALGVMTWETFALRRLFAGSDDAQRMFAVLRAPIPDLRELDPEVPAEIAEIAARALSRDVDARLATAEELAVVLEGASLRLGGASVASWMGDRFAEKTVAIRARLDAVPSAPEEGDATIVATPEIEATRTELDVARPPARRAPIVAGVLGLVMLAALAVWRLTATPESAPVVRPPVEAPAESWGEPDLVDYPDGLSTPSVETTPPVAPPPPVVAASVAVSEPEPLPTSRPRARERARDRVRRAEPEPRAPQVASEPTPRRDLLPNPF